MKNSSTTLPVCHESIQDYHGFVRTVQFWIEGVGIFGLGLFGLAGNVLTIVTLSLVKSNKNFNKLLVITSFLQFDCD